MAKSTRATRKSDTSKRGANQTETTAPPTAAGGRAEAPPPSTNGAADREAIARRAYDLYASRGGEHGRDLDDWLQAERELQDRRDRRR